LTFLANNQIIIELKILKIWVLSQKWPK